MKMILDLDTDLCIGCGACAVACMDQNDVEVESGTKPFRVVSSIEQMRPSGLHTLNLSMACMHCDDAPCIQGCPSGCLSKDPDTNFTVFDTTNCIGCHSCAMACPFGAPGFGPDGRMVKCDGCVDRVKAGMEPACVRVCPFDALKLYTEEEYQQVRLERAVHKMAEMLLEQ